MFSCAKCVHFENCRIQKDIENILLCSPKHFDVTKAHSIFDAIGLACNEFEMEKRKEIT